MDKFLICIRGEKTWRIRRAITEKNKALKGNKEHPNGMSRITEEGLLRDLGYLRAELQRRKSI